MQSSKNNIFAVVQLGRLGDTLLSESLCKNIKNAFPDSKLIYIVAKPFVEVANRLSGVDEVFAFDKKDEHPGFFGPFKFAQNFPYKNKVDYSVITYRHERAVMLGYAIGSKKTIAVPFKWISPLNLLITNKRKFDINEQQNVYKAEYNSNYLKTIGVNTINYFSNYDVSDIEVEVLQKFKDILPPQNSYIVLSPTSNNPIKDWDFDNILSFVRNSPYKVVLTGTREAISVSEFLKKNGADFIDLVQKTTINELAVILKNAHSCVTVDTGSMHLAYLVGTKTICLFFNQSMINEWVPPHQDNIKILIGKQYEKGEKKKIICEEEISYERVLGLVKQYQKDL